jgi:hypothetical protein
VARDGGEIEVPLTTFDARIVGQDMLDDGTEQSTRIFRISADHMTGARFPEVKISSLNSRASSDLIGCTR